MNVKGRETRPPAEDILTSERGSRGLSLIEVLLYVALLGIIAVFITNFLIQVVNVYYRARAEREVLSNARLLLETVEKSVAQAKTVYAPTSKFNVDAGQLSLVSTVGATTEHTTNYLDFWADNGRFFTKQEGQVATPLSAVSVRIQKFRLEWIAQGLGREAVKVTLQVAHAQPRYTASTSLYSTVTLRGNY